jgi:hypothetical protein
VLETARHRITGEVSLPVEGPRTRLSDALNVEGLRFIPVADAELSDLDGGRSERLPFVAVARDHVELAYELS